MQTCFTPTQIHTQSNGKLSWGTHLKRGIALSRCHPNRYWNCILIDTPPRVLPTLEVFLLSRSVRKLIYCTLAAKLSIKIKVCVWLQQEAPNDHVSKCTYGPFFPSRTPPTDDVTTEIHRTMVLCGERIPFQLNPQNDRLRAICCLQPEPPPPSAYTRPREPQTGHFYSVIITDRRGTPEHLHTDISLSLSLSVTHPPARRSSRVVG